ncbi:hypothetical protein ACS0PU_006460 [Formica fusca]
MESDAIAEGFKSSLEMHGIIYRTIIADGDSSVYQAIVDSKSYREQMVTVKKIECTNHLLRNLCKKLRVVAAEAYLEYGKYGTCPGRHLKGGAIFINLIRPNVLSQPR